jgi:hypothetical protein
VGGTLTIGRNEGDLPDELATLPCQPDCGRRRTPTGRAAGRDPRPSPRPGPVGPASCVARIRHGAGLGDVGAVLGRGRPRRSSRAGSRSWPRWTSASDGGFGEQMRLWKRPPPFITNAVAVTSTVPALCRPPRPAAADPPCRGDRTRPHRAERTREARVRGRTPWTESGEGKRGWDDA